MTEWTEQLRQARQHIVQQRREVATSLTKPYTRGQTEERRQTFIDLQNLLEAIDRALEDENSTDATGIPRTL